MLTFFTSAAFRSILNGVQPRLQLARLSHESADAPPPDIQSNCRQQTHNSTSSASRTWSVLSFITPLSAPHLVPSGVPSAATVVIVMCIAALVVVVVLGIYRIHLTHQQEVKLVDTTKEEDVTWGDSALTITVNPMEVRG